MLSLLWKDASWTSANGVDMRTCRGSEAEHWVARGRWGLLVWDLLQTSEGILAR